jgi:hypothetical protein
MPPAGFAGIRLSDATSPTKVIEIGQDARESKVPPHYAMTAARQNRWLRTRIKNLPSNGMRPGSRLGDPIRYNPRPAPDGHMNRERSEHQ